MHTLLDYDGHLPAYVNITDGKTADNKGAYDVVTGGVSSKKLRHLDHHDHYSRDLQQKKVINCKKIGTDDNTADLMTKPPKSRKQIERLFKDLNLRVK